MTGQERNTHPGSARPAFTPAAVPDFGTYSHEQLLAMVEHADEHKIRAIGLRLQEAAQTIGEVGQGLKEHMSRLEWDGEGARAFHAWGADMSNATLSLSGYSEKVGMWICAAANALSAAQKMPPVPADAKAKVDKFDRLNPGLRDNADKFHDVRTLYAKDGPSPAEVATALTKLRQEHDHAAEAMTRLAQAYNDSGDEITKGVRPNFPPMPDVMLPPEGKAGSEHVSLDGTEGGGAGAGGTGSGGSASAAAVADRVDGGGTPLGGTAVPSGPVAGSTTSGHGGTTGGTTTVPPAGHPGIPTKTDGGVPRPPAPVPTMPDGGQPAPGPSGPVSTVPPVPSHHPRGPLTSVPGMPPTWPDRRPPASGHGGDPDDGKPRRGRVAQVTEGRSGTGRGGTPVARPSVTPGLPGVADARPVGSRGPADGVVGGRPAPKAPGQGLPSATRGTVVGAEPGSAAGQGRPGMGYGPGFAGSPAGGGAGGGLGRAGGRRLSSEAGGVAGGQAARDAISGGRPFTQGGSGLTRGSAEAPSGREGGSGSRRPEYLVEEENPSHGRYGVIPPVVD
ncbi:hypothetical protein ACQEVS_12915 [Streptomyces sp. CA-181903]|uniref:hypothetical protein n=1 Tax=Streptomyces sp. CA-181903 TaxID=3240055 RepID=UPI003D8A419A